MTFTEGGVDLVSYFIRRSFNMLSSIGFLGVITTKTISQGDTKTACLDYILNNRGEIIYADRSIRWPGTANVFISLIVISYQANNRQRYLGGRKVKYISSYLDESNESLIINLLAENKNRSFQGVVPLGKGFYLEDKQAEQLIKEDDKCKLIIKNIINGDNLNSHPLLKSSRKIISFFDRTEEEARLFPGCFKIIYETVRLTRKIQKRANLRDKYWQYAEKRPALYAAIKNNTSVLVRTQASKHNVFEFIDNGQEYDQKLIVFASEDFALYSVLNSDIHFSWILKHSGDIGGTTLNYSPSKLFDTFPFPENFWKKDNYALGLIGKQYSQYRLNLMSDLWLGLTDLYNLFHYSNLKALPKAKYKSKSDVSELGYKGILELRNLHCQLDKTVIEAYGWQDINLLHDFYEVEYLPENDRVRYTIHPDARRAILRRLLELNHKIHEQEVEQGLWQKKGKDGKVAKSRDDQIGLDLL